MRSSCGCIALLFLAAVFSGFSRCTQIDLSEALNNNLCSDDFNRADSDQVGGNWNVLGNYAQNPTAQIGIADGKARLSIPGGTGTGIICKNRINQSKLKITARATASLVGASPKLLLFAREQDLRNVYSCGFEDNFTRIERVIDNAKTPIKDTTTITAITPNAPLEIIFETSGNNLTCTVKHQGNTAQRTMTDSTFATGAVGLYGDSGGNSTFFIDDVKTETME